MTQRHNPMPMSEPTRHSAGPTRRAVTRGAAWSVPVAAAVTAAPAFAASAPSPLQVTWLSATWQPGKRAGNRPDGWEFGFDFVNVGGRPLTLTSMEIHSTYHAPATNGVTDAVVQARDPLNILVDVVGTKFMETSFVPRGTTGTAPKDAGGNILLPSYYNDFTPGGDGTIACVSTPSLPSEPSYPDSCRRLRADHTYIIFTWQTTAAVGSVAVYMDATVGCLVTNDCVA